MLRIALALGVSVVAMSGAAVAGSKPPKHCDRDHARPANPYGSVLVPQSAPAAAPVVVEPAAEAAEKQAEPSNPSDAAAPAAGGGEPGGGEAPDDKISRASPGLLQFKSC